MGGRCGGLKSIKISTFMGGAPPEHSGSTYAN